MHAFIDDDEGFEEWMLTHPYGYILNTPRTPAANYLLLHRAVCGQLGRRDPRQPSMTRAYLDVCAMNIAEIQQWVDEQFGRHVDLRLCKFCQP